MDPVSLSASVLTLANAGLSISKFLKKTYSSYRGAPKEVLKIAHEVNICSHLMRPFAEKLKDRSLHYNPAFQTDVEYLVQNVINYGVLSKSLI